MKKLHRHRMPGAWRTLVRGIGVSAKRPSAFLRRFWADTSAITSLEIGLIGFPFFALVFGTFTIGLWYFYAASVDQGIYKGTRAFMTGKFQTDPLANTMLAADFTKKYICPQVPAFIPCSSSTLTLNMAAVSDFSQLVHKTRVPADTTKPLQYWKLTLLPLPTKFCSPQQGDIVYVQTEYTMPNIFGFFGLFHQKITSGATVQVEQFPSGTTVYTNC